MEGGDSERDCREWRSQGDLVNHVEWITIGLCFCLLGESQGVEWRMQVLFLLDAMVEGELDRGDKQRKKTTDFRFEDAGNYAAHVLVRP